jgi:glycosyltransferase involved in cell wall biosynthesis
MNAVKRALQTAAPVSLIAPAISISVALVTRNRPSSVERCLESWRRQTVAADEIVVSDDSDDAMAGETEAIAGRYGCLYTRGPRRGLYANRNHASLQCRSTHIVSADDDHTHPVDYVAVIKALVATDPHRVWIFSERLPGDSSTPLTCPPELHRSGFGITPADPSRCAAIADGASVYPRQIFDRGLRYDETYPFGGLWYLWGKLLARHGWHITFSDRTFVWHHFWPEAETAVEGRLGNRDQLLQQLLATTYVQFVGALWLDRSPIQVAWAAAYSVRRLLIPDSIVHFRVRTRLPFAGVVRAVWLAVRARRAYVTP